MDLESRGRKTRPSQPSSPPRSRDSPAPDLTATSADIRARINPSGFDTDYYVEYGHLPPTGKVRRFHRPHSPATSPRPVTIHLSDLEGIVYHFRVVAVNNWGTTVTSDRTFTFFPPSAQTGVLRQKTGSNYLPDCRAYELVSPAIAGNIILLAQSTPRSVCTESNPVPLSQAWTASCQAPQVQRLERLPMSRRERQAAGSPTTSGSTPTKQPSIGSPTGNRSLDKFIDFKSGLLRSPGPIRVRQQRKLPRTMADELDRFPDCRPWTQRGARGFPAVSRFHPSGVLFSTNFDPEGGGLTSAPGSAYDYDVATEETELISKTRTASTFPRSPGTRIPPSTSNFPARNRKERAAPKEMFPASRSTAPTS